MKASPITRLVKELDEPTMYPRELSWLNFNARVLQEAQDPGVPLIQRVRYLGIFSNNLDEFFRVRVAEVRRWISLSSGQQRQQAKKLLAAIQFQVIALQEEFDKLGIPTDSNRKSVANRLGYHIEKSSKGFTYNFFTCDSQYNDDGTKTPNKIGLSTFEWTLLNDESSLTNVEEPFWFFGIGTAYSKFHRDDEGMAKLNSFSKNFTFKPSFLAPAMWPNFDNEEPRLFSKLKEMGGHGIDGDVRFLTAVFALLNYPRYVRAILPAPKKVSTIRWGRRVPKNEVKVVEIELPKRGVNVHSQLFTGHGSPKRQHGRRGHPRRYKDRSGRIIKEIWIEPKVVGNPELGIINHEYVLQIQKDTKQKKGEK